MMVNTRFCRLATAHPETTSTSHHGSKNWLARTEHSVWGTRRSASTRMQALSRLCGSTLEVEMDGRGPSNMPRVVLWMVPCLPAGPAAIGDTADGTVAEAIASAMATKGNMRFCRLATAQPEITW